MNNKKITSILIFLICVSIPILIMRMFPSTMGDDLYCMFFYYPLIFLISGFIVWTYNKYRDSVKLNKAVFILLILLFYSTILTSFYPKGEYSPVNQLRLARQVTKDYKNLKPFDIFNAIDNKNYLQITALYHKFNLPTEIYVVKYCFNDTILSCDNMYRKFNYFFLDNNVVTNHPDFHFNLDLDKGLFSFTDTIEKKDFNITVSYPNFGATAYYKDLKPMRVIVFETKPKFEYGFTKLFEYYLNITQ